MDILLDQVLTPTDLRIIEAVVHISRNSGKTPSASDIQYELTKSYQLKKTQLYERLNRLSRLGFLSVKQLPRPRRYLANLTTISKGVERWIEEQRASIASLSTELETLLGFLKQTNTESFASAITEKLSVEFGQYDI
ncbi:MAG: hypothetical protein ACFFCP_12610 [Promethearchaeota archaeon]